MAIAYVNGEVNRVFYNGLGVSIKETFTKRDGSEGAAYFTAFFEEDPNLSEGDWGEFSGLLSVRSREYEKDGEIRHSADAVLNSARFKAGGGSEGPSSDDLGSDDSPF